MSKPVDHLLKARPHQRVESHFMRMCAVLPYGGTLRGFGKRLGVRVRNELDPVRWAITDALVPVDEDDDEW